MRQRYFNVEAFEISIDEFDKEWEFVNNLWTRFSKRNLVNGDKWISYACRLSKPRPSSERKENIPPENRRTSWKRPAIDCQAKIKITWLFSIGRVRVERFPGSPDHCHSMDNIDMRKRSKFIRNVVANEAVKNYKPPAITGAVSEMISKVHQDSGVQYLKRQEVANIKLKLVGPMTAHLVGEDNLETDALDSTKFLIDKGWKVEQLFIESSMVGFCFATLDQLENLMHYGWLTLIDSTHKTNKHDWRLFTLYIRDGCGSWNVGGHFFVSREDSQVVKEALKIMRRFAPNWNPRYILADQSSVEANSISAAFPGLRAGQQECDVLLCTVHVMRTWMKNVYHGPTFNKLVLAMHKRTKIGCEEIVQEAIRTCPVEANVRYIRRNYLKNLGKWGLWARQHSPLLLQVTSTNPLESYHSELKTRVSASYGLIGKLLLMLIIIQECYISLN